MSDYKEIRLTEDEEEDFATIGFPIDVPTLFIPPKRKVIKLKDLPNKAKIFVKYEIGTELEEYVFNGEVYRNKNASGEFFTKAAGKIAEITLLQGPKTVWEGGECPVPDGAEIKICYRDGDIGTINRNSEYRWDHIGSGGDIIWYQITGNLADGYVVEK